MYLANLTIIDLVHWEQISVFWKPAAVFPLILKLCAVVDSFMYVILYVPARIDVGNPENLKSLSSVVFTVMVGIVAFFVGFFVGFLRIFCIPSSNKLVSSCCAEVNNTVNNASIAKTMARV